jgi:hypothetical protein
MAGPFRLKARPRVFPGIEKMEGSAGFRRETGKRPTRRARDEGWDSLETTDQIAVRINLLRPSLRLLPGVFNFEKIRASLQTVFPKFKALLDRFTEKEWSDLVEKGLKLLNQSFEAFRSRVKGRLLELNFLYSHSLRVIQQFCEKKVRQVLGPGSNKWNPKVIIFSESYSIYLGGRKQFADVLFVVFDRPNNPTKAWIVAIVESKSETNALELISYGAYPANPDSGEFTGQLHLRTEQMDNLVIELPGYGKFSAPDGTLSFGTLRKGGSADRPWPKEDTLYVGVVPNDTDPATRGKIDKALQNTNSMILEHENITGAEATKLAGAFVENLPSLDALSK